MRWAACVLLTAALVVGTTSHHRGTAAVAAPRLDVLVVAGQSNALGYESFVIDPRTHLDVFTDAGRSPADRHVLLTWDESGVPGGSTPVALDTPQVRLGATSPVFGPEVGLARALYAAGHQHLLIVKVAISGSSLAKDWVPGESDYRALLGKVASAMTWARASGWAPKVSALYWFQGETDAMNPAWAASYGANLVTFLRSVRAGLHLGATGPVTIAQTDVTDFIRFEEAHQLCPTRSCSGEWFWNEEVMRAQAAAAGPRTYVVPTSKLARFDNFIHLSDAAELALGRTFGTLTSANVP